MPSATSTDVIVILVLIAIALVLAWVMMRKQRSEQLRARFGPEYERVVRERGDPRSAEAVLERREKRVERLHIRPLEPAIRDRFADAWRRVQARFVDDPQGAVSDADRLVSEVMTARGYPVWADFEQRAEDISVDHPHLVENYRAAATIAARREAGRATTEDLRQAMRYYRALFDELLEVQEVRR
jgi:hypothetical protein